MRKRGWLLLALVAALVGCFGGQDPLVGRWAMTTNGYSGYWVFESGGRFEYVRHQDGIDGHSVGTFTHEGDTVVLRPEDAGADGPRYESVFMRSELMNGGTLHLTWEGHNQFQALMEGTDLRLDFTRTPDSK